MSRSFPVSLSLTSNPHCFISPVLQSLPSRSKARVGGGEELLPDQYYNRVFLRPGLCPKQSSYLDEKQVAPVCCSVDRLGSLQIGFLCGE